MGQLEIWELQSSEVSSGQVYHWAGKTQTAGGWNSWGSSCICLCVVNSSQMKTPLHRPPHSDWSYIFYYFFKWVSLCLTVVRYNLHITKNSPILSVHFNKFWQMYSPITIIKIWNISITPKRPLSHMWSQVASDLCQYSFTFSRISRRWHQ